MTTKTKSRDGVMTRAASKPTDIRNSTATCIKALIVRLALWGWLPLGLATWLFQRGELRND